MDWYFISICVVFCAVALALLIFALSGPTSSDCEDFSQNAILQERVSPVCLSMPLPANGDKHAAAPTLTSPYPAIPPPLGFKIYDSVPSASAPPRVAVRQGATSSESSNSLPYPANEEIAKSMPFPLINPEHSPQSSPNTTSRQQRQDRDARHISSNRSRDDAEPPPAYSEVITQQPVSARNRRNRFSKRLSQ